MSGIDTVVPFYGSDPIRKRNLELVVENLRAGCDTDKHGHVSSFPLWIESGHNQANARNNGADNSVNVVLLFNDADTLAPYEQIVQAATMATLEPGLVFAYTNYIRLSQRTTESLTNHRDAFEAPAEWEMYGSLSSGCVAISRACFLEVGGYDETWLDGYEDYDFALRCNERWPNRRVDGDLVHLWHPRPRVEPEEGRDKQRFLQRWPQMATR